LVKEQLAQKDATIEHLKLNFEAHQNIYDPGKIKEYLNLIQQASQPKLVQNTELKKLSIEDSLSGLIESISHSSASYFLEVANKELTYSEHIEILKKDLKLNKFNFNDKYKEMLEFLYTIGFLQAFTKSVLIIFILIQVIRKMESKY